MSLIITKIYVVALKKHQHLNGKKFSIPQLWRGKKKNKMIQKTIPTFFLFLHFLDNLTDHSHSLFGSHSLSFQTQSPHLFLLYPLSLQLSSYSNLSQLTLLHHSHSPPLLRFIIWPQRPPRPHPIPSLQVTISTLLFPLPMLKELITLPLKFSLLNTASRSFFFGKTASLSYSDNTISFSFFLFLVFYYIVW